MRVPLLDLTRQHAQVAGDVATRVDQVFASQQFILGKTVEEFEGSIRALTGCGHAVGMASGTDAQLAILMALGIGPGDAVITTPYTFFATAGTIHRLGAEPVFVDVDPGTLHMDAGKLREFLASKCHRSADGEVSAPSGNRLRAIIPIHLFGSCCAMDEIQSIGKEFALTVIEDAAQAIGAEYPSREGTRSAGAIAEFAFFSFFPTKNLGGAGDAGMALCQDAASAEKLRLLRNHGMERRYHYRIVGGNFRLDALQAAVLLAKLPRLREWNARRLENARLYRELFATHGLLNEISLPVEPYASSELAAHHTYHQFVIRSKQRDALMSHLERSGIGCAIYYPVPLHRQECFLPLGYKQGDFPVAETASLESLALPIFPELTREEITAVVTAIAAFYQN